MVVFRLFKRKHRHNKKKGTTVPKSLLLKPKKKVASRGVLVSLKNTKAKKALTSSVILKKPKQTIRKRLILSSSLRETLKKDLLNKRPPLRDVLEVICKDRKDVRKQIMVASRGSGVRNKSSNWTFASKNVRC